MHGSTRIYKIRTVLKSKTVCALSHSSGAVFYKGGSIYCFGVFALSTLNVYAYTARGFIFQYCCIKRLPFKGMPSMHAFANVTTILQFFGRCVCELREADYI